MGFFNASGQTISTIPIFPCVSEEIFVMGLKEGEKLVSHTPFIIFNDNGLAVGLDSSFKQFYHLDSKGENLNIINLTFNDACQEIEKAFEIENGSMLVDFTYEIKDLIIPSSLIIIIFVSIIARVIYAKNR